MGSIVNKPGDVHNMDSSHITAAMKTKFSAKALNKFNNRLKYAIPIQTCDFTAAIDDNGSPFFLLSATSCLGEDVPIKIDLAGLLALEQSIQTFKDIIKKHAN